jgi:hypothetical protein
MLHRVNFLDARREDYALGLQPASRHRLFAVVPVPEETAWEWK